MTPSHSRPAVPAGSAAETGSVSLFHSKERVSYVEAPECELDIKVISRGLSWRNLQYLDLLFSIVLFLLHYIYA